MTRSPPPTAATRWPAAPDQITAAGHLVAAVGGAGADTLTGGAGTDTLYSADFGPGGFSAVDDIGLEHDRLSGGGGDDTLAIGYGDDADGGAGTDTLRMVLTGATRAVSLDTAAIVSGGPYNFAGGVIQNIETVLSIRGTDFADSYSLGTQPGLLSLDAGGGDDTITSHGSATSILGGAGDDRLISGSGADSFDGGSGIDTIDYSAAAAGVSVNMKTGAGAGGDTFTHVEAAVGSAFADTLVGTAAGAMLSGGAGDDRLEIGARDVATLGAGADLVFVTPGTHSGAQAGAIVTVTDWTVDDHLQFGATTGAYTEISAASFTAAAQAAEAQENAGYNFVAVQVQSDVYLFGSPIGRLHFDDAVRLVGTTLDTVSAANVGLPGPLEAPVTPSPPPPPPASVEPTLPAAPSAGIGGGAWTIAGDADHAHLRYVLDAVITAASTTHVQASIGDVSLTLDGFGFATDASGHLSGGTATSMTYSYGAAHGGPFLLSFTGEQVPLGTLATFALNDDINYFFLNVLPGGDRISGSSGADVLRGYDGDDVLIGGGGADTLGGGFGNDVLYAEASPGLASAAGGGTYLRGDSGDDYIIGSRGFDDANGNMGNDTISTGAGDDYSVGGQGSDLLFGDAGNDIVWGNLGNDTCVGGEGNDQVRGGQGDDVLYGGAGNDFISGDRGNDTETGGAGADIFHTSQDAGIDRVLDFRLSEGDRVQLDPGTTYTLAQVGDDAVIDLGGGNQMILVGVSTLSLTPGWIFGA
jgi:Ca2+-binding RTX toxin-like protein